MLNHKKTIVKRPHPRITYRFNRGLSLIELMIALTISLFMLLGVFHLLFNLARTTLVTTNLSSYQESGRFATEFLTREVRQAGLIANLNSISQVSNSPAETELFDCSKNWVWLLSYPIYGYDNYSNGMSIPSCISSATNSDILILRMSSDDTTALADLVNGRDYMYATFSSGELFRKGTDTTPTVVTGGEHWQINTKVFYIKNNPAGVPTLYQYDSATATQEQVVDGVESMHISYGLRSSTGDFVTSYVSAPAFGSASWDDISTVQIDLLVRSLNPNGEYKKNNACKDNSNTYTLGNYSFTPTDTVPDCYYRRVFTTIVQLRNG